MDKLISSQFHDITLHLTGWDEPSSGRVLHIADLLINGLVENDRYFEGWNRLNERLDKLTFDAPDKRFVYIPAESGVFVIDTITFDKIRLPYKRLSAMTFIGNYFAGDKLVMVHSDEIILFNTSDLIPVRISFPDRNLIWSEQDQNGDISATYKHRNTQDQRTEKLSR